LNKGLIKKRLLKLKSEFEKEIKNIGKNGISNSLKDNTSELSSYDNHPADLGSETFERGKDIALKDSQKILLEKVHDAIINLEKGTYGICENCNKNIEDERLEAIPYTTYCIRCKKELEKDHRTRKRPIEEKILSPPFGRSFRYGDDYTGYDGEDTWQDVSRYGTSNSPQDVGGRLSYDEIYIDSDEDEEY